MSRRKKIDLVVLGICAGVLFVTVTAASGATALPMPTGNQAFGGVIVFAAAELGRRMMKKLDDVSKKCEKIPLIDVALRGYDGQSGVLAEVAQLRSTMDEHLRNHSHDAVGV